MTLAVSKEFMTANRAFLPKPFQIYEQDKRKCNVE